MIGLGKWSCSVDTMMFRGEAELCISDNNGAYDFKVDAKGIAMPAYEVSEITEDGSTLTAIVTSPVLPGKQVPVSLTFDGDTVTGFVKIPLLGKIKLKNGHRIG